MDKQEPTAREEQESTARQLAAVRGNWAVITDIVEPLRTARQENHFAERTRLAMRERRR